MGQHSSGDFSRIGRSTSPNRTSGGKPVLTVYPILLLISGVLMIVLGAAVPNQGTGSRVLNIVIGSALFGYGFYLLFLFQGGTYYVFYYVFVLPLALIVRTFQARRNASNQRGAAQRAATGQPLGGPQSTFGIQGQPSVGNPRPPAEQGGYGSASMQN
jgi:hypothetical protein